MGAWQRFLWADDATEATVAVVADDASDATALLQRLGSTEDAGSMTFAAALDLQGSFYDDGTFDDRAVFQVDRLSQWWGLVEPNGFRASFDTRLLALAGNRPAVSFDQARRHAADLPFEDHQSAAAFALIERWTGITITEAWFLAEKPTFAVQTATPGRA